MTEKANAIIIAIVMFASGAASGLAIGALINDDDRATVGGHTVYDLDCEEDEAIGYDPRDPGPRELKCVPYEVLEVVIP